ncbi:V-type ATP synthase subunit I [Clostridiaceae bacterium NSJ-31]|uniref:V-type ATP synthase subunit I n=1 Tax=Ligaoa zhengdingensis TaxID=2763658 RepID=A0A926I3K6_9FIRM|nr:V-type ATPase 116kDa subunit family protein [Ligaoa zhengdingensis]MBC8545613.1 V-type ATP synthase subunit I [Ligaoa zhengdingensis]
MSIEKMTLVQITGHVDVLDKVLRRCSDIGQFHPEQPAQLTDKAGGFTQMMEENPYKARLNRIVDIGVNAGITLKYDAADVRKVASDGIDDFLDSFHKELLELSDRKRELTKAIEEGQTAEVQLRHLDSLDVSLDELFACEFLKIRFGRLPVDSYGKLAYYKDRLFFFVSLSEGSTYHWGMYITTVDHVAEVDDIFSSLYFERIRIPEAHGTPGIAKQMFKDELVKNKAELEEVNNRLAELIRANEEKFQDIYSGVRFRSESFDLRRYVSVYKGQFHLTGFLPTRDEEAFRKSIESIDRAHVEFKPQDSDKRLVTPTKLNNCKLFQPFEMFVDMYGTPSYNEIDPTPFVGITYTLLYGIMFGDLGQGLVIALLGALLWKFKKMNLGRIMTRIGISAACFGLVYGSVFGMEHLLDPLYTDLLGLPGKPVEVMDPLTINNLLIFAIGLGVVLIIASMTINIVIGLKNRDFEKAIFSNNGLAGMVFYVAVLLGVLSMLSGGQSLFTPLYILAFIVLPILVIFLKHPLGKLTRGNRHIKPEGGIGSFILEGFFELFEVVLSFVTNTMSFLRVGGFIISHAGMMAVVLTLTEMMTGSGSIVVMILGNAFVMALEGFIVGIQGLRLEFYELFSRYFEGQGKPFRPVVIQ